MLKLLETTKGNMSVSRDIVFKWHRRFYDGRPNIEDIERQDRDAVIHTSISMSIKTALEGDHRLTIENCQELSTLAVAQFILSWPVN